MNVACRMHFNAVSVHKDPSVSFFPIAKSTGCNDVGSNIPIGRTLVLFSCNVQVAKLNSH